MRLAPYLYPLVGTLSCGCIAILLGMQNKMAMHMPGTAIHHGALSKMGMAWD